MGDTVDANMDMGMVYLPALVYNPQNENFEKNDGSESNGRYLSDTEDENPEMGDENSEMEDDDEEIEDDDEEMEDEELEEDIETDDSWDTEDEDFIDDSENDDFSAMDDEDFTDSDSDLDDESDSGFDDFDDFDDAIDNDVLSEEEIDSCSVSDSEVEDFEYKLRKTHNPRHIKSLDRKLEHYDEDTDNMQGVSDGDHNLTVAYEGVHGYVVADDESMEILNGSSKSRVMDALPATTDSYAVITALDRNVSSHSVVATRDPFDAPIMDEEQTANYHSWYGADPDDDAQIPLDHGERTTAVFDSLYPYLDVLIHAQVGGESKVLVICPYNFRAIGEVLHDIVQVHRPGHGGYVEVLHASNGNGTMPDVATVRAMLKAQKKSMVWDMVVCFGYPSNGRAVKEWLEGVTELVRSQGVHARGHIMLELGGGVGEHWQAIASRYDRYCASSGIRLVSLNSMTGNQATDHLRLAARCLTLARDLARVPKPGLYSKTIAILRIQAGELKTRMSYATQVLAQQRGPAYGVFIPDSASDSDSWWDLTGEQ